MPSRRSRRKKRGGNPVEALGTDETFRGLLRGLTEAPGDWERYLVVADYCTDCECHDLAVAFRWMYTHQKHPLPCAQYVDGMGDRWGFKWSMRGVNCVFDLGRFDGAWKLHEDYLDAILAIAGQLKRRRAKFCVAGDVGCFGQVDRGK